MIHDSVIIDPSAKIAKNVKIGPWTIIGPHVEIGEGSEIGAHVIVKSHTRIGKRNKIYQFCSIGEEPQAKHYKAEETWLEIGDDNIIREFCTIHRGTIQGNSMTRVGHRNFIMAYVHIAHDCFVGNDIVFANNSALSGHVTVHDFANFGGFSAVHQFCSIGAYCFVAGETSIGKDVPPFVLVSGHPASVYGLNTIGLKRHGFSDELINVLKRAYNVIYRQGYTSQQAIAQLQQMQPEAEKEVGLLIASLSESTRGIVR